MTIRSPVLFVVFNRPETTQRVFDAIRVAQPPRLYVAADGPRLQRHGEVEVCDAVRRIATAVDWPCEVLTRMSTENLGCKRAVSSAITWFFEHEAEGIILEDDCLPDSSFFAFCDDLLEHYRDDTRVMCISGDNFVSDVWTPDASYYFSRYMHIWGWATWRRAWRFYDVDMKDWQRNCNKRESLKSWLPSLPMARIHWRDLFDRVASGHIDTWDYQWTYACWSRGGLACMPKVNLISNIGFGQGATHTVSPESKLANLSVKSISVPLEHPTAVEANDEADRWTSHNVLSIDEQPTLLLKCRKFLRAAASGGFAFR